MKSKVKIFLLLIVPGLLFPTLSYSQEPWSLEQCVNYALQHNIQIKQQTLNTEYNSNVLEQSKAELYPNLNASASYGASFGRALDQTTYQFTQNQTVQSVNMNLSSSVTLFSGLQKVNTVKKNEFSLQASLQDLEKLKNDISLNIAAAYLQILFNRELLEVAKSQVEITKQQVDRTNILVNAGSLPKGNLLEIQSQQATEELQVVNTENQLMLSILNLSQILDLESAENFDIVIPELSEAGEAELLYGVDSVYAYAVETLPQIKGAEYRLSNAERSLDIAKGSRIPRLSLSANYGTGFSDARQQVIGSQIDTVTVGTTPTGDIVSSVYPRQIYGNYPMGDQFRDNVSTSIFLNLSIPIFSNFQIRNGIRNSKINVENYSLELENTKNMLYKEIQQAYADALAALKRSKASQKALIATEESFKYTQEKYNVGLVSTVDYNIAKNQLTKTKSDLLQAKYDYIFKINILNFYRGEPIKL
ncbi:MAG: TolC family protein [Bacteroidales bacterium]|nr:TolC family protein [Bacteroidales bacterium]